MKTKITKEELQKTITQLQMRVDLTEANSRNIKAEFEASDKNRRTEFAKAFGWKKKRGAYDYSDEWHLPTWEEIFIEQGKLLSAQNFNTQNERIENISRRLNQLDEEFFKSKNNQGT